MEIYMDLSRISDIGRDDESSLVEFFEISRDAFLAFDKNLRITYANPQIENFLKTKRERIIGEILWKVFPSSKEFLISEEYHRAMYDGIPQSREKFIKSIDKWAEVNIYPLKNRGLLVSARDITDKKHEELELRENEYLFRTSFEKIDQAFMIIELLYDKTGNIDDYRFIKVNDMVEKYTGPKNDDLIGKTVKETFLKIEPSWMMNYDKVNKTGKPKHFINFNGATKRWHDVFCFPYDNNKIGVFFKDVTEKVQAEEALYKSEEMYKAFMMAYFDSIYKASPDWTQIDILKEKGTFADMSYSDSNWIEERIHPDDRPRVAGEINKVILNKSIFDIEHRILKKDGSTGWIRPRAVPITNKNGNVTEWLGAASDITL